MQNAPTALLTTIRVELARRQLTQTDLAAGVGMTQVQVSRRMSGRVEWTISEVDAVARFLGIPFVELFDQAVPA